MAGTVDYRIADGVAVLRLNAPPVHALDRDLCDALVRAFDRAWADTRAQAILLGAAGEVFSGGADVRELDPSGPDAGSPAQADVAAASIARLVDRIEASPKPTLAVLTGAALGTGAELALAARWRIGTPAARIGFPDIALALVPGAGGTQRLPRRIGLRAALDLLLTGATLDAEAAMTYGLLDGLVRGDPLSGGLAFLKGAMTDGRHLDVHPSRDRSRFEQAPAETLAALREALRSVDATEIVAERAPVDAALIACCAASVLLPVEQGLAFEAVRRADSLAHPTSRALRYVFLAERRISPSLLAVGPGGRRHPTEAGAAVVSTLDRAWQEARLRLIDDGVPAATVDAALRDAGIWVHPPASTEPPPRPDGASPEPAAARDAGVADRCVAAVVGAMAREGLRWLRHGTVASPSDVDALAIHGLGLGRTTGGPMWMAGDVGLVEQHPGDDGHQAQG